MSPHPPHLGIVVGVDGSPSSTLAVEWAARDAEMRNVPIKLVHVVAPLVAATEGWSDIPAPSDYTQRQEASDWWRCTPGVTWGPWSSRE